MAKVIRYFPFFTLFGLLTIGLFFLEMTPRMRYTDFGESLVNVLWMIIIPLWVMRLLVVMLGGMLFGFGGGSFPFWYNILTIPALLLPYILANITLVKIHGIKSPALRSDIDKGE